MQKKTEIASFLSLSFLKLYIYATHSESSLYSSEKLSSFHISQQCMLRKRTGNNWE